MYITSNASVNTETKATLCLYKSGNGNGSCIRLEIPVQILYLSSARSTNRVVPTTTKFSLLLNLIRQNGRRQQLRFVIKFRYTTSSPPRPSPSSIELTSNGRGKKKISSTNSPPSPRIHRVARFRMKFPVIAFRETWRLATLHARFSRGAPIIKVIELVIAVIFHRFNPLLFPLSRGS